MTRIYAVRWAFAALLTVTGGCSIAPDPTTVQLLDPRPDTGMPTSEPALWTLTVARPETDPTRDSNRVLVRTGAGQLKVHPSARWIAPTPDLFRTLLVRNMRDRELLSRVGGGGVGSDRILAIDLRRFELAETGGALVAEISAEARLHDGTSGGLLGRRLFEARRVLTSSRPEAITQGFETVLAVLLPEFGEWVIEAGAGEGARTEQ